MERAGRAAGVVLPPLALVLAAALYFRDVLPLPEATRYFGGDFATYFYPVFRYVAEEIGAGRLPHWTPYVGVGYPLLSDIEASVFYPPIRLLTLFTGPPSYLGLELHAIAHYVAAGLGMFVLARWIGLPALAAGVGALTYMFSGFLWAHAAHLTIVQSAAWVPWLLAAHARALATGSARWTVAAGGFFALLTLDEVDLYGLGSRYRQLGPNLWENGNLLPRAFLVEEVLVLPDTGHIVPTLLTTDPRRTAIVERPPACLASLRPSDLLPPPTPPASDVELVEYHPTRVRLRTRHPRPALLVLADAHYKEWRARVDGRRAGIHYVNLLFRGVCVPAGEHEVEFRYHPFAFERGAVIALLAGLAALGAVVGLRGRGRWRSR